MKSKVRFFLSLEHRWWGFPSSSWFLLLPGAGWCQAAKPWAWEMGWEADAAAGLAAGSGLSFSRRRGVPGWEGLPSGFPRWGSWAGLLTLQNWEHSSVFWGFPSPYSLGLGKTHQNTCVLAEEWWGLNRGFVLVGFAGDAALDFMSCLQTQGKDPGWSSAPGDLGPCPQIRSHWPQLSAGPCLSMPYTVPVRFAEQTNEWVRELVKRRGWEQVYSAAP